MEVDEVSSVGKIKDEEVLALKHKLDSAISHTKVSCPSLYLSCPGPSTGACHNTKSETTREQTTRKSCV